MCNWHMPINKNDSDNASGRRERKLPDEQEKIRLFFDSIGKLCNGKLTWWFAIELYRTYPSFFHHICHLLHGGIVVISCKVEQNSQGCNFTTPDMICEDLSSLQSIRIPYFRVVNFANRANGTIRKEKKRYKDHYTHSRRVRWRPVLLHWTL